jgi:hypothetical protein
MRNPTYILPFYSQQRFQCAVASRAYHYVPKPGRGGALERATEMRPILEIFGRGKRLNTESDLYAYTLLFRSRQYSEMGLDSLAWHSSYEVGRATLGWSGTPVQAGRGMRGFARRGLSKPRLWRRQQRNLPLSRPRNIHKEELVKASCSAIRRLRTYGLAGYGRSLSTASHLYHAIPLSTSFTNPRN